MSSLAHFIYKLVFQRKFLGLTFSTCPYKCLFSKVLFHLGKKSSILLHNGNGNFPPKTKQLDAAVLCSVIQSCPILCDPMDYVAPQAPLSKRILQARVLQWVAYHFSRGCSDPGIELGSPALQADSLPDELPGKPKQLDIYI